MIDDHDRCEWMNVSSGILFWGHILYILLMYMLFVVYFVSVLNLFLHICVRTAVKS